MPEKAVLIHYHEISLKGENRPLFERALLENVRKALGEDMWQDGRILLGRIVLRLRADADEHEASARLKRVFGIANFAFVHVLSHDFDALSREALELVARRQFATFRIAARRSDKSYPLTSQEINERLGTLVREKLGKKVDLEHPDLTCFVEIAGKEVFVYFEKHKGYGGLPVGTGGKVCALVSAGFDSPVASWMMMRRGCEVVFVHFHSYPSTSAAAQENVKEIVKVLTRSQYRSKLYLVPFLPIQQAIVKADTEASLRVILYRRFMARIAEEIAKKENCGALVTGESLGQVASQTLENIAVISAAAHLPVFRPLIGENKERIIAWAREIGTHDISSQPYEDCCSLFVPEHPETKAKLSVVENMEEKFDVRKLVDEAMVDEEILHYGIQE